MDKELFHKRKKERKKERKKVIRSNIYRRRKKI